MTANAPVTALALMRAGAAALAAAAGVVGVSMALSAWHGPLEGGARTLERLPPGYGTALYVPVQDEDEAEQAWTQLVAAFELVRSSRESLAEAESLRGTAASLAHMSRENVEARKAQSDAAASEAARYQQVIAEAQLGLADGLVAKARTMSEGAVAIFESARQNVLRLQGGDEWQDPAGEARVDPPDLIRTGRSPGAARRSRRA